jgi:hypothetical protein
LFFKNKIIADKKKKYVKNSVYSPTGCIPVGSPVKKPPEERIKKIKDIFDQWFQRKKVESI